jgi:hypothetical protein
MVRISDAKLVKRKTTLIELEDIWGSTLPNCTAPVESKNSSYHYS